MTAGPDYDVMIVGGGPVGLLLGNMLGQKGLRALLIEKRPLPPAESMAIGITPPSMELFQKLNLDEEFIRQGVRVNHAKVHEGRKLVGELSFHSLEHGFPFILAIPQATTIEILERNLQKDDQVIIYRETSLLQVEQSDHSVSATIQREGADETEQVTASFLVGCDGQRSLVRELAGIGLCEKREYPANFMMADFADDTDLGHEAHLFFSRHGSIESFPLPKGQRRWILQTDQLIRPPDIDFLIKKIDAQAGYNLADATLYSESSFGVRRFVCQRYSQKRIVLCGDAAHVMSPVGGQGMNTGFADAELLTDALVRHLHNGDDYRPLFDRYDHHRRIAFNVAATRAERGMWMGTRRGRLASALRYILLTGLLRPPFIKSLPAYFAMLTIPYRSLETISDGEH